MLSSLVCDDNVIVVPGKGPVTWCGPPAGVSMLSPREPETATGTSDSGRLARPLPGRHPATPAAPGALGARGATVKACGGQQRMIVVGNEQEVNLPPCPRCDGPLRRWGFARARRIRQTGGRTRRLVPCRARW